MQPLVSSLSAGDCPVHRLRKKERKKERKKKEREKRKEKK